MPIQPVFDTYRLAKCAGCNDFSGCYRGRGPAATIAATSAASRPFPAAPLALIFVHFDAEAFQWSGSFASQGGLETLPDVASQQFCRRVGNGEQNAIASREHPTTVLEGGHYLVVVDDKVNQRMAGWQQHVMVEFQKNRLQRVT